MGRHHKFGKCNKDCITQFFVKFILPIVKTQIHYLIDQFAVTLTKEDCSFAFCSHKEILHYIEHFLPVLFGNFRSALLLKLWTRKMYLIAMN